MVPEKLQPCITANITTTTTSNTLYTITITTTTWWGGAGSVGVHYSEVVKGTAAVVHCHLGHLKCWRQGDVAFNSNGSSACHLLSNGGNNTSQVMSFVLWKLSDDEKLCKMYNQFFHDRELIKVEAPLAQMCIVYVFIYSYTSTPHDKWTMFAVAVQIVLASHAC